MIYSRGEQPSEPEQTKTPESLNTDIAKEMSTAMFNVLEDVRAQMGDRLREPLETLGGLEARLPQENRTLETLSDTVDKLMQHISTQGELDDKDLDAITAIAKPFLADIAPDKQTIDKIGVGASAGRETAELAAQEVDGLSHHYLANDEAEGDQTLETHGNAAVDARKHLLEAVAAFNETAGDNNEGTTRAFARAHAKLEGELDEVISWVARIRAKTIEQQVAMLMIVDAVDRAKYEARQRTVALAATSDRFHEGLAAADATRNAHGYFEEHSQAA